MKDGSGPERSGPCAGPGNPAGSSRDDGGVGERSSPGHAASLVPVDPGVVLLDLGLVSQKCRPVRVQAGNLWSEAGVGSGGGGRGRSGSAEPLLDPARDGSGAEA